MNSSTSTPSNFITNHKNMVTFSEIQSNWSTNDLSKYSLPSDKKSKTDYTYAHLYNDHLKDSKNLNLSVEIPQLSRRSIRKPTVLLSTQEMATSGVSSSESRNIFFAHLTHFLKESDIVQK